MGYFPGTELWKGPEAEASSLPGLLAGVEAGLEAQSQATSNA